MIKEKFIQFLQIFDSLGSATQFVRNYKYTGSPNKNDIEENITKSLKESYLDELYPYLLKSYSLLKDVGDNMIEPNEPGLLTDVLNEIELNFCNFPEYRNIYIKDILRQFYNISSELIELDIFGRYSKIFPSIPKVCKLLLDDLHHKKETERNNYVMSVVWEYIYDCSRIFDKFLLYFDTKCLNFNIDLFEIQKEINVSVFPKRDSSYNSWLIHLGYGQILKEILKDKKISKRLNKISDNESQITEHNPKIVVKSKYNSAKNSIDVENNLIFDNTLLDSFHGAFNGYLWESTEINAFKNWFRAIPDGKPEIINKMQSYFCYAMNKIANRRKKEHCTNFGTWIKLLIGNINYYTETDKAKNTKDKTKIEHIDSKFSLFL